MGNWQDQYKTKCISFDEAVAKVKSGDKIVDGHGCGRPDEFSTHLVKRAKELKDVKLLCGSTFGRMEYVKPEYEGSFRFLSLFNGTQGDGKIGRQATWEGRADFIPMPFSQQEAYIRMWEPDILFTMVTPPNKDGYVSMGVSVDYTRTALDVAKIVIAQVNEEMPWLDGDAVVHVDDIDYFVEHKSPLDQLLRSPEISDTDRAIAKSVASLIDDGATLQIGVGAVTEQVVALLTNHKHLGVHSELGSAGMLELMEKGVVDNSLKTLDPGYTVCSLLGGMKDFYDAVDHHPGFLMKRSSYVISPMVIAQQKNMCSVNSAIEIDLYGQVVADMIGYKQFSGVGGQLDFLRGASMAEGGRSIICMPSTAAKGNVSRIVPQLKEGAAVSDTRFDVMYIVTEYGIAELWGKSVHERALALIEISHPNFREELEREYYAKFRNLV